MGKEHPHLPASLIFHLDMDAFFAAIEQRDYPALKGQPIAVGGPELKRGVVSTASYEARKFGVRSAMPLMTAKKLCPQLEIVPPNIAKYIYNSLKIVDILARFTPLIEPVSIDEAFLDMTLMRNHFGDSFAMASQIKQTIYRELHLTCSIGIARHKYLAKIASDLYKPDQITIIPPLQEKEFLMPLEVGKLPGIGKKTAEILQKMAIFRVGQLMELKPEQIVRIFGKQGNLLLEMFRGEGPITVAPLGSGTPDKSLSNECTLPVDSQDSNIVLPVLKMVCQSLGRRLRFKQYHPRTLGIKLRASDFKTFSLRRSFEMEIPTNDQPLFELAKRLLSEMWDGSSAIRLIGVFATSFKGASGQQLTLFSDQEKNDEKQIRLQQAIDHIKNKFGEHIIQ